MTAVLLSSINAGISGWVPVKRNKSARVVGIEAGDLVMLEFLPEGELSVDEDGLFPLPAAVEMVRVSHYCCAVYRENGGVSVDLLR